MRRQRCRKVYKARERATGRLVALKRIRMEMEKEGVSEHLLDGNRDSGFPSRSAYLMAYLLLIYTRPLALYSFQ